MSGAAGVERGWQARLRPSSYLTRRGVMFLCTGALTLGAAGVLGRRDLLYLSVFLLVLPLVAVIGVRARRVNHTVRRWLAHEPAQEGAAVFVSLQIDAPQRVSPSTMVETLPASVGASPRFQFPSASAHGEPHSLYEYSLTPPHRGSFTLGGVVAEFHDPFMLAWQRHRIDPGTAVTAIPGPVADVTALLPVILGRESQQLRGDSGASFSPMASEQDIMTRQYRAGDPMRRIHWPSTARHQELMVRQEDGVSAPEATLFLDRRASSYPRFPRFPDPPAAQSLSTSAGFEWQVHALHSVAHGLRSAGLDCTAVDNEGHSLGAPGQGAHQGHWLMDLSLTLATLELAELELWQPVTPGPGPLIAFLGMVSRADAQILSALARAQDGPATALICSTTPLSTEAAELLASGGWTVLMVAPDTRLEQLRAEVRV